jgi:hypothetical protein
MAKSAGWIFGSTEPKIPAYTFFVGLHQWRTIEYILKKGR